MPSVYTGPVIDTHTHPLADGPYVEQFTWVLRKVEIDRVLFGSDFPLYDPAEALQAARSLGFTDSEQAQVLHDNAAALL